MPHADLPGDRDGRDDPSHFGGWIGTGRGWTPWIHIADEVRIIAFALEQAGFDGPVNLTAPTPVRAREFARVLGRTVGRRAWLPVPTPFVRMGLGVITDILVRGKRVIPARASELGYRFRFPVLDLALHDLLGQLAAADTGLPPRIPADAARVVLLCGLRR